MLTRRITFRLYPKPAQEAQLFEWRRLHAYLYNSALADRKDSYQKRGETVDYFDQQNRLPAFKETWQEYRSRSISRLDIFCQVNNPFFCIILERGRRRSSHQKALSALGSPCFWGAGINSRTNLKCGRVGAWEKPPIVYETSAPSLLGKKSVY